MINQHLGKTDIAIGGWAYELVAGRQISLSVVHALRTRWDVKVFVIGHFPAPEGYHIVDDALFVMQSDHDQGALLQLDLWGVQNMVRMSESIVPLGSSDR